MKDQSLRVLIVEDSEVYASLIIRELKKGGYNPAYERMETAAAMKKALKDKQWDIILCDYSLPKFNAPSAIALLKESNIDIPLIIVTGAIGEETAAECMRLGAQDYIMKNNLSRLCPAISRELEDVKVRNKQKQAEEALRINERRYRIAEAIGHVGNWEYNLQTTKFWGSDEAKRIYGFDPGALDFSTDEVESCIPEREQVHQALIDLIKADKPYNLEFEIHPKNSLKPRIISSVAELKRDEHGNPLLVTGVIQDITKRKQDESARLSSLKARLESEERYKALFDRSLNLIYVMDFDGKFIDANNAALNLFGYKKEEIRSVNVNSLADEDQLQLVLETIREIIETGIQKGLREIRLRHKDGRTIYVEAQGATIMSKGKPVAIQVIAHDITERKRAEKVLRESEYKYKSLIENIPDIIFTVDLEGKITFVSSKVKEILGYENAETINKNIFNFIPEEDHQRALEHLQKGMKGEKIKHFQIPMIAKSGEKLYFECSFSRIYKDGAVVGAQGTAVDITERKIAEKALQNSENKYRLLADNVNDVIFVLDMNLNYTYISPSVKLLRGYEPEEVMKLPTSETLTPFSWDLAVRALSEFMELEKSGHGEINKPRTLQLEMRRKDGTTVWTEVKVSIIRDENQQSVGIMGVTRDITERKDTEEKLHQTLERLKRAVGTTIQVLVSAVESRDPYTAGHQKRVADLARTIATEIGLPSDKIEGIRMAGSVHDIGKLSIPAEILSKPTNLTNIEFSLIKEHAKGGYEMLKDVESPWPLAEIVYQHHERMNGSGYPRKLKGNDIIIEARIIAVADVVEAMASHRPYRPTLGIEAALEEIEKNKGILYDDTVADTCLKLFREKGYQLK